MLKITINYREIHYHFSLSLEWTLNFKIIHYHYKGSIWINKEQKKVVATSAAVVTALLLVALLQLPAAIPNWHWHPQQSPHFVPETMLWVLHVLWLTFTKISVSIPTLYSFSFIENKGSKLNNWSKVATPQ